MGKKKETVEQVEGETPAVAPTISLADICAEMGIKPQSARIKLRKKMTVAKGEGFRWVFPAEQKDEIIALLTPAPKAAAEGKGEGEGEGDGKGDAE